jgi:AcrR family transcriptional regulator
MSRVRFAASVCLDDDMARTRGWGGHPPGDDDEARRRILDAARRCIDQVGTAFGLSDVARELGITRQTIYRYYPSTEDLLLATAIDGSAGFLTRLEKKLASVEGPPAAVVVEGVATTLEAIADDPQLGLILSTSRIGAFAQGFTSPYAQEVGRAVLQQFPVDWAAAGFEGRRLDELVEHMLRIVQSLALDPGSPPRRGKALRAYLDRWLAPCVLAISDPAMGGRTVGAGARPRATR